MARSEHATRRDPRDPGDLERKRRIKQLVGVERARQRDAVVDAVGVAGIPISTRDVGPYIHYPASVDDLRAILARVPSGTANGLGEIELCIDRTPDQDPDPDRLDPFLGLLTYEEIPGVYQGSTAGSYVSGERSRIILHGHVFDPDMRDRVIAETFLRLRMLASFVRELGHHRDHHERTARGRWRADDDDARERQADEIEYAWTRDYVLPYLEEVAPEPLAELERWIARHGGIALPLASLLDLPSSISRWTGEQRRFSHYSTFYTLFADVQEGLAPCAIQVSFARSLHYGEHYDEALAVLDQVDRDHPGDPEARVMRADIYVHQERYAEAEPLVTGVLAETPDDTDALEVLADIAHGRHDWHWLRALCARRALLLEPDDWRWMSNEQMDVHALLELGELDAAEAKLATLFAATASRPRSQRRLRVLEAVLRLQQGRHADALAIVPPIKGRLYQAAIIAITFEASYHLGLPCDLDMARATLEPLRAMGYVQWVERLRAIIGPDA